MPETGPPPHDLERDDYDEFQFLEGHAKWAGLTWSGRPVAVREQLHANGRALSFLRWGADDPELVLLHGAGQNAHSWDTFAMAVGRPALAVDLPGHGHSAWRTDQDYSPSTNALAIGAAIERVAPRARAVVGMSLGGLTAIKLMSMFPDPARRLVLIDITPAAPLIDGGAAATPIGLMAEPRQFASWQSIVEAAHSHMPNRDRQSIVPGVRHNVKRLQDGSWSWRYDRFESTGRSRPGFEGLWGDLIGASPWVMLVKGGRSTIVTDDALAEFRRRVPVARIEVVPDSGHSVQSDAPVELARLVNQFVA